MRGRSVLVLVLAEDQLISATALIELDGVARRIDEWCFVRPIHLSAMCPP
jgi:hypothetical protein